MLAFQRIFLDLGNVLFYLKTDLIWNRLITHCSHNREELAGRFYQSGLSVLYETGAISTDTFFNKVRELLGYQGSDDELRSDWNSLLEPIPDNLLFARELSDRYPVGIISNTNDCHQRYMETTGGFCDFTDLRIYSHEVGFLKPRLEIYQHALALARLAPHYCLFIDDREENVQAAQSLGMQAFTFPAGGSLRDFFASTIFSEFTVK